MVKNLVIFTAGSKQIGLGHLTRMRTLTERLGLETKILTTTPVETAAVFRDYNVQISPLSAGSKPVDIKNIIPQSINKSSIFVLDPPYYPNNPKLSSGPSWRTVAEIAMNNAATVIRFTDEETPSIHHCDVLINGHPNALDFADTYQSSSTAQKILAGPTYFLLDNNHILAIPKKTGLFVSLGGSDHNDLSLKFAPALKNIAKTIPVHIVLGEASGFSDNAFSGINIHRSLAPTEFASLLKGAHLALTASGNTLYERIYHRVPGLSVAQFPRQDLIGQKFDKLNLTRHLGMGIDLNPIELGREFCNFIECKPLFEEQNIAMGKMNFLTDAKKIIITIQKAGNTT